MGSGWMRFFPPAANNTRLDLAVVTTLLHKSKTGDPKSEGASCSSVPLPICVTFTFL